MAESAVWQRAWHSRERGITESTVWQSTVTGALGIPGEKTTLPNNAVGARHASCLCEL